MHFTLLKISPPEAPTHGFDDAVLPLYYALRRLGFSVEIRENAPNPTSKNIVFGSCVSPHAVGRLLPGNSIIYNLEQLTEGSLWLNNLYLSHLRAFTVWEYSLRNMEALAVNNIAAEHLPLGYVSEMTRLSSDCAPEFDVLFYGLVNGRRQAALDALQAGGASVRVAPRGTFGNARDALIRRARVILNVHFTVPASLETVRLGYLWANRKVVVSERRYDTEVPSALNEACAFFAYEELAEGVSALLRDTEMQQKQAEKGFTAFSACSLQDSLEKLVGRRVHTARASLIESAPEWAVPALPSPAPSLSEEKAL